MQQMMERFEVSKATIKRDLDLMRDQLGAPIIYSREERRYRYDASQPEFEIPGLWFNASELHALLAVEQLLETMQPGLLAPYLKPFRRRIHDLLERSGHSSETVASKILLQSVGQRKAVSECFASVAGALLDERVLEITYHARSKSERSERRVHPQRMLHYRDNWYLIAWCEKAAALRTFSLDRIENAAIRKTPAKKTDESELAAYLNRGFGIFSGESEMRAVLRFTPHIARWVADEQWHPQQQGRWDGGHYELTLPYTQPTELVMEILKYGPDVEVIAPEALRRAVVQRLKAAVGRYE